MFLLCLSLEQLVLVVSIRECLTSRARCCIATISCVDLGMACAEPYVEIFRFGVVWQVIFFHYLQLFAFQSSIVLHCQIDRSSLRRQSRLAKLIPHLFVVMTLCGKSHLSLFAFSLVVCDQKAFLCKSSLLLIESCCSLEARVSQDYFPVFSTTMATIQHLFPWIKVLDKSRSNLILSGVVFT